MADLGATGISRCFGIWCGVREAYSTSILQFGSHSIDMRSSFSMRNLKMGQSSQYWKTRQLFTKMHNWEIEKFTKTSNVGQWPLDFTPRLFQALVRKSELAR
jgi:hypothetical protein